MRLPRNIIDEFEKEISGLAQAEVFLICIFRDGTPRFELERDHVVFSANKNPIKIPPEFIRLFETEAAGLRHGQVKMTCLLHDGIPEFFVGRKRIYKGAA
jgi:hypothetical protein